MGAVHVGVRHDNDTVITQLVGVEFLAANAATQCRDEGTDFCR